MVLQSSSNGTPEFPEWYFRVPLMVLQSSFNGTSEFNGVPLMVLFPSMVLQSSPNGTP